MDSELNHWAEEKFQEFKQFGETRAITQNKTVTINGQEITIYLDFDRMIQFSETHTIARGIRRTLDLDDSRPPQPPPPVDDSR